MLTLYFAPGTSSFAVHIALHEIGVPFEGKPMSFKGNDLRSPAYLALNPEGKVPTLIIDGRPLTEVAAILYYLAKRFPDGCCRATTFRPTRRRFHGCPLPLPPFTPRAEAGPTMPGKSGELPIGGWAAAGRWAAIRSPTSICFGSIGGSPIRSSPRRKPFPISPRIMPA